MTNKSTPTAPTSFSGKKTGSDQYLEPSFELLANNLVGATIPNITNNTCGSGCK